ncbi:hypothetical protein [Acidisoma silvae]|uniref:Uncharacterized protein n=1 Tax=Acidisoma silvae TaxID=2802396 RepID=A0A963YV02_9PROT|nr:hypothetical protein [Acidisoma silvae]MCB8876920.1 hypothetical protein [Acidisoma silvae]
MRKSEVIEVDGVFVGAAILQDNRDECAFYATHDLVRSLHGQILPSLKAIRSEAARQFRGMKRADLSVKTLV